MAQARGATGAAAERPPQLRADLIWYEASAPPRRAPALFLDRDGVLIEEKHHLRDPDQVALMPGAAALLRRARLSGLWTVLVTNQSGIGRGLFGWREFAAVQRRLVALLAAEEACLDAVVACPFHPQGAAPYDAPEHPFRKPNPGMLLEAAERLHVDLARSWTIGDRARDLEAGRRAGLAGGLHVATGYGRRERTDALALASPSFRVLAAEDLTAAPDLLPVLREGERS